MVLIKIKKGNWISGMPDIKMIYEKCPNKHCDTGELHYPAATSGPDHMSNPHCPDCKADLIGFMLEKEFEQRIDYYLER